MAASLTRRYRFATERRPQIRNEKVAAITSFLTAALGFFGVG